MGVWLGCALLFIEIVLRFCPVSDYFPAVAIDEENPISRPAFNRTGTRSRGWRFSPTNTIHYNNYGFINIHYYDPVSDTPLLAVVGDGTLEALSVPFEETLQGRLAAQLGIDGRAYSFAGAGAPLSQYLAWAQFARDEFKPEGFVFAIVRDDFDQSLAKYQDAPGFHYYHESRDGYELRLLPYQPTGRGDFILRHSALARYLTLNLQLQRSLQERSAPQGPHALDGSVIDPEERLDDSKTIAKVFLDELPRATGVDASRILFLVSGVELDPVIDPYWHSMRTFFTDEAVTRGYETIEMQPIPLEENRQPGDDWNGTAHALAAQAVTDSKLYAALFKETPVETATFEATPAEAVIFEPTFAGAVIPEASPPEADLSREYPID